MWEVRVGPCGNHGVWWALFLTERDARAWINRHANGSRTYTLYDPDHDIVVESSWPVLMVA